MKLKNIIKESKTIKLENENPCWDGYQQIGTKMKDGKEVPNCVPKNEVKEASSKSMPGQWVGFIEKTKSRGKKLMGVFKSAMGAKQWLSKNNSKLLNTDDVERVGIMTKSDWDTKEAKWAVESVNEMNVNKKFGSKYDIGAGSMGNGTTFWNRAQEVRGDYKTIAHISDNGKVTFYDKKLPDDVKKHIEDYAKTKTEGMVENFIPSVGTIDKFKLKDLLLKNPKVKDILSDTEYKFLKSNNTDVIMHQSKRFNSITTDGKLEFEIDLKNNKLVKPLGKARKAIVDYYSKTKTESVNENSKNKGHWERVGNQTIVDSNFINLSKGVLPNSELVHLGGGDFALKTPDGEIVFSRTSKPTGIADDFVGRVHRMTDNKGGKLLNNLVQLMGKSKKAVLSMSEAVGITDAGCGCGGVKTSNPYSLSEFVIKENDYKLGNVEYTAKNMGPVDIMKLAFAYHQAPITKLAGKNIDHRIRVARDLGRLIGKNHINPNERGKEPAWLLYPYKGKLVSTEEYKEIYNGLFDKLKRLVKYIKNADPATRRDAAAAKAAARADIKKEF
jgi:hypothetical protein